MFYLILFDFIIYKMETMQMAEERQNKKEDFISEGVVL